MALTLVTSGTTTPTVGTASTMTTQTPSTATPYVLEVNTGAMQAGDVVQIQVQKTEGSAQSQGATLINFGYAEAIADPASTAGFIQAGTMTLPFSAPALSTVVALSFSQAGTVLSNTGTVQDSIGSTYGYAQNYMVAANPLPANSDWVNPPVGHNSISTSWVPSSTTNTSMGFLAAAAFAGVTPNSVANAYAGANGSKTSSTTPTQATSASVNANDLVVAYIVVSANSTITQPSAPWISIGNVTIASPTCRVAMAYQVPTGAGTVTYNPTFSMAASSLMGIAAFPTTSVTSTSLTVSEAAYSSYQMTPVKQTPPIAVGASETVTFVLNQVAGTARSFPWQVWHL